MKRLGSLYISGRPHVEADETRFEMVGMLFLKISPCPTATESSFRHGCGRMMLQSTVWSFFLPHSCSLESEPPVYTTDTTVISQAEFTKEVAWLLRTENTGLGKRRLKSNLHSFVEISVGRAERAKHLVGENRQESQMIKLWPHNPLLRLWGKDALLFSPKKLLFS